MVRYHSQIRTSDRAVRLQKHNEQLEHNNRHDALTGLRNRYALNEDIKEIAGQKLTAFMVDVNYFKIHHHICRSITFFVFLQSIRVSIENERATREKESVL